MQNHVSLKVFLKALGCEGRTELCRALKQLCFYVFHISKYIWETKVPLLQTSYTTTGVLTLFTGSATEYPRRKGYTYCCKGSCGQNKMSMSASSVRESDKKQKKLICSYRLLSNLKHNQLYHSLN